MSTITPPFTALESDLQRLPAFADTPQCEWVRCSQRFISDWWAFHPDPTIGKNTYRQIIFLFPTDLTQRDHIYINNMSKTNPRSIAEEAIETLDDCKRTGDKVKISGDALDAIGIDRNTRVANWGRNSLPITYNLHRKHEVWLLIETHTNQQGPERTIHYITAGNPSVEHEELDLNAAREILENAEHWTANTDQAITAIENRQMAISDWWRDGIINGNLAVIGGENRMHFTAPTTTIEYHGAPELDRVEKDLFRDAASAVHPVVGDHVRGYQHPFNVEYSTEVTWSTDRLNPEELVEQHTA